MGALESRIVLNSGTFDTIDTKFRQVKRGKGEKRYLQDTPRMPYKKKKARTKSEP